MFTGIIKAVGRVAAIRPGPDSTELTIECRLKPGRGASVAVNGACLTVVSRRGNRLRFDVLNETLRRTNFGELQPGSLVNLEQALVAGERFDGHFVQGHVDGTGRVNALTRDGKDYRLDLHVPANLHRYLVEKGSLAVDGISLTIAKVVRDSVRIWIIPHTRAVTNLRNRRSGESVNLEVDILAKYVARAISGRRR